MGKRTFGGDDPGAKRPKLQHDADDATQDVVKIHSAAQVQELLAFSQDTIPDLKKGIRSFKAFLEAIAYGPDRSSTATEQGILRDLLASQRPVDADASFFPSLAQAWSFAVQTNNESLQSHIPALFALLLRTISTDLKFREHGLLLGKSLLQLNNVKLISKGLSASKSKEHIISPCLRVLVELINFDGGSLAKLLWTQRQHVLDAPILSRNVAFWKKAPKDEEESRRKPSVRSNALRYLLANFKFQPTSAKAEICKNANVLRAVFEHMKYDSLDLLQETFSVLKAHIFRDPKLSRQTKAFIMHERNLASVAGLYRSHEPSADSKDAANLAHDFLLFLCTGPEAGVLKPSTWYPPGVEQSLEINPEGKSSLAIDLGLDSVDWYGKFDAKVPVRNRTLLGFLQGLRPFASLQESELMLAIFKACPELVASYFKEKTSFSFDPKLTATWVGYSAFLFSMVSLPLPDHIAPGADLPRIPPPVSIVLENILPAPLSRTVLTRCLNQKSDLITFFAIRILTVAFQKLQVCLKFFRKTAQEVGPLWEEAQERLVLQFSARCPIMKDVIATWRSTSKEHKMQSEAVLRLLKLYYQATPMVALQEKFDISVALGEALASFKDKSLDGDADRIRILELNHMLQIARWTPDLRWFSKSGQSSLSPAASLLKILATRSHEDIPAEMHNLLAPIMRDHTVLQEATTPTALQALLASLTASGLDAVLPFLDDAFERTVKRPIKYEDDIEALAEGRSDFGELSLLWATLMEQWPFAVSREADAAIAIAKWLAIYLGLSEHIGEDVDLLKKVRSKLLEAATSSKLKKALSPPNNLPRVIEATPAAQPASAQATTTATTSHNETFTRPDYLSPQPPAEAGLHEWTTHASISDAITANTLPPLINCLSSPYPEVRTQSLASLRQIHARLKPLATPRSSFPDAAPFYMLLGELVETAAPYLQPAAEPGLVPGVIPAYASLAANILLTPTHPLYTKVNQFHSRAPSWDATRLAHYWLRQCVYTPATDPVSSLTAAGASSARSAKSIELDFLVSLLFASIQRATDVEITLRKRGLFEHVFALASGTEDGDARLLEGVLRLAWRVALVGESTTMITRAAVLPWLSGVLALAPVEKKPRDAEGGEDEDKRHRLYTRAGIKALAAYICESCDRERVEQWSGGGVDLHGLGLAD